MDINWRCSEFIRKTFGSLNPFWILLFHEFFELYPPIFLLYGDKRILLFPSPKNLRKDSLGCDPQTNKDSILFYVHFYGFYDYLLSYNRQYPLQISRKESIKRRISGRMRHR